MSEVMILGGARTPIGKFGGAFRDTRVVELGAVAAAAALDWTGIDASQIDEVCFGIVYQAGARANPARQVALRIGLPVSAPALCVNQQCSSGVRAIAIGADQIRLGRVKCVLAGGMDSMSQTPYLAPNIRWGAGRGPSALEDGLYFDGLEDPMLGIHMGCTAETVATEAKLSREEVDRFALRSQERAARAQQLDLWKQEIAPVSVPCRGGPFLLERDECPRRSTLVELATLAPVFREGGICTAGNSSQLADGAAAVVLADEDMARSSRRQPLGRLCHVVSVGVAPEVMGIGPVPAIRRLLLETGLDIGAIDLVEINEAFACQTLACIRALGLEEDKVNVNGGAVALGHPPGMTGSRLILTVLHELRRRGGRFGVVSLCAGGGPAIAALVEAL